MNGRTPPNERPTLAQYASGTVGMSCPKCGCRHLLRYGDGDFPSSRRRYRKCRNCGHRVITDERIIRDVVAHEEDPADESEDEPDIPAPGKPPLKLIRRTG